MSSRELKDVYGTNEDRPRPTRPPLKPVGDHKARPPPRRKAETRNDRRAGGGGRKPAPAREKPVRTRSASEGTERKYPALQRPIRGPLKQDVAARVAEKHASSPWLDKTLLEIKTLEAEIKRLTLSSKLRDVRIGFHQTSPELVKLDAANEDKRIILRNSELDNALANVQLNQRVARLKGRQSLARSQVEAELAEDEEVRLEVGRDRPTIAPQGSRPIGRLKSRWFDPQAMGWWNFLQVVFIIAVKLAAYLLMGGMLVLTLIDLSRYGSLNWPFATTTFLWAVVVRYAVGSPLTSGIRDRIVTGARLSIGRHVKEAGVQTELLAAARLQFPDYMHDRAHGSQLHYWGRKWAHKNTVWDDVEILDQLTRLQTVLALEPSVTKLPPYSA